MESDLGPWVVHEFPAGADYDLRITSTGGQLPRTLAFGLLAAFGTVMLG
jgi:hypothetical protein